MDRDESQRRIDAETGVNIRAVIPASLHTRLMMERLRRGRRARLEILITEAIERMLADCEKKN